ncbi:hypothetical protein Nepgr_021589 [Nepenthes gracilis]|uniref:Glycosyltransferase N-terminal domain-containing protein n=1 Tax=Nepenthes gracilis TaxID=150966 RepID=A0AAD3SYH6_NEPGR|nr:hypothetical protein Nepgr_021589 [Nepenthes gracilis]
MAEEAGERRPKEWRRAHVLGVPYPTQGHINPMIQFCKCLASRGIKVTFAITIFVANSNSFNHPSNSGRPSPLHFDTISDGFDVGGFAEAGSIADYLSRFEAAGSESLAVLLRKHADSGHPVDCVVYDSFLPWALDVAKQCGAIGAPFFTQACAVNFIYYYLHHGLLKLPISSPPAVIPGLPPLEIADMPGFIGEPGSYPAYFRMCLKQFSNLDEADFGLVNTCYELEAEVRD